MRGINEYDIIIFDCDGVLLDINKQKVEAFRKVVSNYSEEVQEGFVKYCADSFGISRYKKFKDFFDLFAKKSFEEEEYSLFLKLYSEICKNEYLKCEMTFGAIDFLRLVKSKGITTYIASGSDQNELREIFNKRYLKHYFNDIFGSPTSKKEIIKMIKNQNVNKNILFIGDSIVDMETANICEIDFVYMSGYTIQSKNHHNLCCENAIIHINNLAEFLK